MTQAEFNRAQKIAREEWIKIARGAATEIKNIYIKAADEIAEQIIDLKLKKRGNTLTGKGLKALEKSLRETGQRIASGTETETINSINKSIQINNAPHLIYISDAIELSGTELINSKTIQEMYATVNERLIEITYSRIWQDGYTFVERIWGGFSSINPELSIQGVGSYWQKNVKQIILTGLSENRDIYQIAEDIQVYAGKGKIQLMKRYGELERGTAGFAARIPKTIDWRAIRIARSELYNSIQEQARIQGRFNPAIRDGERSYRWNLTTGAQHDCPCPELAADSPYKQTNIPDYPHSNCLCYITHIIMPRDQFVDDLVDWGNGVVIPYLDDWFNNVYLPFLR